MSNAVMGACMVLILLFLAPFFKYTPLVALATIIIVAMIGLIDLHEIHHLYNVDKFDFCICMAALLGVLFVNMKTGLALSFLLSIIRALLHVARPGTCKLEKLPGTDLYRDIEQYPDSRGISGILILQLGSVIYFANASYLRERITRWIEAEEIKIKEQEREDLQYVILDISGVAEIDNSGIGMLLEAHRMFQKKGIQMALINPSFDVAAKLTAANFNQAVGKEWFFISVGDAIAGCRCAMQEVNLVSHETA